MTRRRKPIYDDATIERIRKLAATGLGQGQIARMIPCSQGLVSLVARGRHRRNAPGPLLPEDPQRGNLQRRLTDAQISQIRLLGGTMPQAAIARIVGCSQQHVCNVLAGTRRAS